MITLAIYSEKPTIQIITQLSHYTSTVYTHVHCTFSTLVDGTYHRVAFTARPKRLANTITINGTTLITIAQFGSNYNYQIPSMVPLARLAPAPKLSTGYRNGITITSSFVPLPSFLQGRLPSLSDESEDECCIILIM